MGTLKPGATYIYERHNDVVFARELGAPIETRKPIGWDYNESDLVGLNPVASDAYRNLQLNNLRHRQNQEWQEILELAKTNPALQKAVDNVIIIYKLSKDKIE
jgi:hypothetical protein